MNSEKRKIDTQRGAAIFRYCDELHTAVDELYELMLEGTDEEEKKHIDGMISKLQELNKDR